MKVKGWKRVLRNINHATINQWWLDFKRITDVDEKWLAIWLLIFISFVCLDIFTPTFPGTNLIKYMGIFLCIIYARQKYYNDLHLSLALLFTFTADTILVWTNFYVAGVFIFCFAQFMHMLRLTHTRIELIFTYAAAISLIFAFAIMQGISPIYAISCIYGAELITNLVLAFRRYTTQRKDFKARCTLYGFVAFICCDTCVAIRFLALQGLLSSKILPLVSFLVWIFYYPSQVLLANSSTMPPSKRYKIAK